METNHLWSGWKIDGEPVGKGAFGTVYRIIREDYGHTYVSALKVIRVPQNSSEYEASLSAGMDHEGVTEYYESIVNDLVDEFALMSQLRGNSNIVSYEDHQVFPLEDEFGWEIFIRMEYVTPLLKYIGEHPLSINDVICIGIDICKALEACQKYNIIHRDIKPENIFRSDLGDYKLGDFGIARQMEKTNTGMSKKGTDAYMAPEVYFGKSYNSTVDTYSLGIVLYRLLNDNRVPFLPTYPEKYLYADWNHAKDMRLTGEKIPLPRNAQGRLGEIVLKACAYDPQNRYESPAQMRMALEAVRYSEGEANLIYPEGDILGHLKSETQQPEERWNDDESKTRKLFFQGNSEKRMAQSDLQKGDSMDPLQKKTVPETGVLENPIEQDFSDDQNGEASVSKKTEENLDDESQSGSVTDQIYENSLLPTELSDSEYDKMVYAKDEFIVGKGDTGSGEKKKTKLYIMIGIVVVIIVAIIIAVLVHRNGGTSFLLSEKTRSEAEVSSDETVETDNDAVIVPDVNGKKRSEATETIENAGLDCAVEKVYSETVKKGIVISQIPMANAEAKKGDPVILKVSEGVKPATVPNVVGMSVKEATKAMKKERLKMETTEEYNNSVSKGKIISQSEEHGSKVDRGTTIIVKVSKGKKPSSSSKSSSRFRRSSSGSDSDNGTLGDSSDSSSLDDDRSESDSLADSSDSSSLDDGSGSDSSGDKSDSSSLDDGGGLGDSSSGDTDVLALE